MARAKSGRKRFARRRKTLLERFGELFTIFPFIPSLFLSLFFAFSGFSSYFEQRLSRFASFLICYALSFALLSLVARIVLRLKTGE